MFHFCQYDNPENSPLEAKFRYDICSGQFKHINPKLIDKAQIVILNKQKQVLVAKENDGNWGFVSILKTEENSPKQAILKKLQELEIAINQKTLEHFCYQKTLEPIEFAEDKNGNPIWDVVSSQVIYTAQIQDFKTESDNLKWLEITQIPKFIDQIFGLQKTVEVVVELLQS